MAKFTKKQIEDLAWAFAEARVDGRREGKIGHTVHAEIRVAATAFGSPDKPLADRFFSRISQLEDRRLGRNIY